MIDALITLLVALELIVLLGVWVALPLVPAVLIYRYFPDTKVAASGPLAGMTVKTSGAFAAYLIVFLLIFAMVNPIKDVIGGSMRPFWEIKGKVKLVDENGKPISGEDLNLLTKITFEITPDPLDHARGKLSLKVPQVGGEIPEISVKVPNWGQSEPIDFNRQPWLVQWTNRNSFKKTIDLGDLMITRVPPRQVHQAQSPMDTVLPQSK
jgi:hypothetical protein